MIIMMMRTTMKVAIIMTNITAMIITIMMKKNMQMMSNRIHQMKIVFIMISIMKNMTTMIMIKTRSHIIYVNCNYKNDSEAIGRLMYDLRIKVSVC